MTRNSAFPGDMDETPGFPRDPLQLDDGTVDRLLNGLPADDAPPSYRGVAELLHAAKTWVPENPEPWTARFGSPTRVSVAQPVPQQKSQPPKPMRRLRVTGAVLVGSATLFMGLGVAGALPGPAQGVAADLLGSVGVSAPNPDEPADVQVRPASANDPGGSSGATNTNGASGAGDSNAGKGATVSSLATDDSTTGVDKGTTVSGEASDGEGQAGDHGTPASPETDPPTNAGNGASNGNGNGASNGNGNGASNGNGYTGQGNPGNPQPNKP